jgi:hypothetical protein
MEGSPWTSYYVCSGDSSFTCQVRDLNSDQGSVVGHDAVQLAQSLLGAHSICVYDSKHKEGGFGKKNCPVSKIKAPKGRYANLAMYKILQ